MRAQVRPGTIVMHAFRLRRPDDWHLHVRDGDVLKDVVPPSANVFARALVMPNLRPPVATVGDALAYRARILEAAGDTAFEPYMTLYWSRTLTPADIEAVARNPFVMGVKLYPVGVTTHAEAGVVPNLSDPAFVAVLEALQALDVPLLVHGESPDASLDPFDREAHFLRHVLAPMVAAFPRLRVVLEHVTTREAVAFVRAQPLHRVAATVTVHHLLFDRRDMFRGGLRPHLYCLPLLKREDDRQAIRDAVFEGDPRFFLGTDSAPHARDAKESACGCAGVFSAPVALPLLAELFDHHRVLPRLEAFCSQFGADFYRLGYASTHVTLTRTPFDVPATLPFGAHNIVPLAATERLAFSVAPA